MRKLVLECCEEVQGESRRIPRGILGSLGFETVHAGLLNASYESRLRVGTHDHPGAHPLQTEYSRLTNAPLELVTRELPEDRVAEERRRRSVNYRPVSTTAPQSPVRH